MINSADQCGLESAFSTRPDRWDSFRWFSGQKESERLTLIAGLSIRHPDIFHRFIEAEDVHITFLGVGDGQMELNVLDDILQFRRQGSRGIHIHCEDPSMEMRTRFYEELKNHKFSRVEIEFSTKKLEDIDFTVADSDLVIASHMLYYVSGNLKNPLTKIVESIKQRNGLAVIVLHNSESDRYKLLEAYNELTMNGKTELHGQAVRDELELLNPAFVERATYTSELNIQSLFEVRYEGAGETIVFQPSEEGKNLLSFLFRTDWDSIPEEIRKQLGLYITKLAFPGIGENRHDFRSGRSYLHLNHVDDYIWVRNTEPAIGGDLHE